MTNWKTFPKDVPADLQVCWVRLNYWFGQPFQATWYEIAESWISVDNSITYPAWSISRWRAL